MRGTIALWIGLVASCGDNVRLSSDASPNADAAVDVAIDAPPDGPNVDWNDGATSGTRLKLVWYRTADGVKAWPGTSAGPSYYDSLRGEDCFAAPWTDGNTYCTPSAMQGVYADAACSAAAGQWWAATSAQAPAYIDEAGPSCPVGVQHLYQRGAKLTMTQYYTRDATGACTGPTSNSTMEFYAIGAEVPATELVTMTTGAPEGTGALQLKWWQTADGLRAVRFGYDTTLADDCVPFRFYAGAPVCFPRSTRADYFGDSTCTQRELAVRTQCPQPLHTFAVADQSCPKPTATFYPIAAPAASTALYWINGTNTCQAVTPNPAYTYYSIGAEITPTALAWTADTVAGVRLEPYHYTASSFRFRDRTLYDTALGMDCQLLMVGGGTAVCVPLNNGTVLGIGPATVGSRTSGVVNAFGDAACTTPLVLAQVYLGPIGCAAIATPTHMVTSTTSNSWGVEVHRVGAAYTGPIYFQSGGFCGQYPTDPRFAYYDGSTVIPSAALATATRVVDP